jgi:sugar lactone lactonase YvrE
MWPPKGSCDALLSHRRTMNTLAPQSTFRSILPAIATLGIAFIAITSARAQDTGAAKPTAPASSTTREASKVYPLDGAVDPTGTVWIVDRNKPGLWQYQSDQLKLDTQGSNKFRQPLNAVRCLAISRSGEIALGDPATREVYRKDATGQWKGTVNAIVGIPVDLAFLSDGTLLIADLERRVLWKQTAPGSNPEILASVNPRGVFVDHADRIWVISQDENQLVRVSKDGQVEPIVTKRTFEFPHQVVVNSKDQIWVSDGYRKGIWSWKIGEQPRLIVSGEPLQNPVGLFLVDDQPVIVDPHAQAVFKLTDNALVKWFAIENK